MEFNAKVRTCLWFDGQGEEAARFYVSLLPDSQVENVFRPDPAGPPLVVEFTLAGTPYMTLNGGSQFEHSEAASISVLTRDQEETDRLWTALTSDGGKEGRCAWLKDRFGVSWQIVPEALPRLLAADDKAAAARAMNAMMAMGKIDIAGLEAAFNGG
jgi:predicted 3-demethylubiquinone-9 3-methyltransferase (glyoxalase superfamily)